MNNERVLSFRKSTKLNREQAQNVSAAAMTSYVTANATYDSRTRSWDPSIDATIDL